MLGNTYKTQHLLTGIADHRINVLKVRNCIARTNFGHPSQDHAGKNHEETNEFSDNRTRVNIERDALRFWLLNGGQAHGSPVVAVGQKRLTYTQVEGAPPE